MARVDPSDVREIAEFDELDDMDIMAFIDDAHLIVDTELAKHTANEDRLAMVEKWLAAHFGYLREQRAEVSGVGESRMEYEGATGMGLEATRYGQQAMLMDPTGALSSSRHHTSSVHSSDTHYPLSDRRSDPDWGV